MENLKNHISCLAQQKQQKIKKLFDLLSGYVLLFIFSHDGISPIIVHIIGLSPSKGLRRLVIILAPLFFMWKCHKSLQVVTSIIHYWIICFSEPTKQILFRMTECVQNVNLFSCYVLCYVFFRSEELLINLAPKMNWRRLHLPHL